MQAGQSWVRAMRALHILQSTDAHVGHTLEYRADAGSNAAFSHLGRVAGRPARVQALKLPEKMYFVIAGLRLSCQPIDCICAVVDRPTVCWDRR